MTLQTTQQTPVFGINYDLGYVGFVRHREPGALSRGITYFTRWDKLSEISVTHTFIVTAPNACVEARWREGVQITPLSDYFNGEAQVFFRKPVLYSEHTGQLIASLARQDIGAPYDKLLLIGHALGGLIFFRFLNFMRWRLPEDLFTRLLDTPDAFICCEHVAHVLRQFTEYCNRGCLRRGARAVNPQMLFEDEELFEPWKKA